MVSYGLFSNKVSIFEFKTINTNLKTSDNMNCKKYTLALLALCLSGTAFSQSLSQARKWFTKGEFQKAKPVFKRLVKQSRSNASYNFWYGACCYETGELMESIPYLEKSAERKVINGYLYLSKAYYDLYRFDEAIENLEQHIYWLERKNRNTKNAEKLMLQLRKGANMIRGVENVCVIDSFVVDKQNFLSAYKLSPESGHLTMAPDSACTAYTNEMHDKSFFAQRDAEGNSSLYSSIKMIDKWSAPVLQNGFGDNLTHLNYPFMDSDGSTLYFSAQGEGSLGGYDIFITRTDSEENTFLRPDNLGFPFNSPANDYMYAIDDYNNLGWFASDRYQPKGKVCIYVFVPNEQKVVYDYDNTTIEKLRAYASLRSIAETQTNADIISESRNKIAALQEREKQVTKKKEFNFIINDEHTYHSLDEFHSPEAKKLFQAMLQMEKDYHMLKKELKVLRSAYTSGNQTRKENLTPEILDKEQRVDQLENELEDVRQKIRMMELAH